MHRLRLLWGWVTCKTIECSQGFIFKGLYDLCKVFLSLFSVYQLFKYIAAHWNKTQQQIVLSIISWVADA